MFESLNTVCIDQINASILLSWPQLLSRTCDNKTFYLIIGLANICNNIWQQIKKHLQEKLLSTKIGVFKYAHKFIEERYIV